MRACRTWIERRLQRFAAVAVSLAHRGAHPGIVTDTHLQGRQCILAAALEQPRASSSWCAAAQLHDRAEQLGARQRQRQLMLVCAGRKVLAADQQQVLQMRHAQEGMLQHAVQLPQGLPAILQVQLLHKR
jgi:hypothetical protein